MGRARRGAGGPRGRTPLPLARVLAPGAAAGAGLMQNLQAT